MPPKSPLKLAESSHHALDWPFNWPDFPKSTRPPQGTRPKPRSLSAEDEEERIAFPESKDKMAEQRKTRATPLHPSTARTVTDLTNTSPFHRSTPRPMVLGEGPIYRASDSTLHWFSCLPDPSTTPPTPPSLHVLRVDPETGLAAAPGEEAAAARVVPLEESVTVAAFRAGKPGSYVCAYYAGIAWMDEETGRLEVVKEIVPQGERGERRMNDGGVDAKGRFWVVEIDWAAMARFAAMRKKSSGGGGLSEETGGEELKARLWRFDPDGSLHEILSGGLAGGNGLAWSPDNKVMYVNDSPRGLVYAFDFDLESGNIANKRVLVDRSSSYGDPDGMVVDTEGNLWVAGLASDRVMVFSPQGEHLRDILLPARNPSCTTWGGKDFDILYMATGMDWAKESDDKDGGGHMYMFKPGGGVKGFAKHVFAG